MMWNKYLPREAIVAIRVTRNNVQSIAEHLNKFCEVPVVCDDNGLTIDAETDWESHADIGDWIVTDPMDELFNAMTNEDFTRKYRRCS